MMSELDATRAKLATFVLVILLAVDAVNPVKIFLHVFGPMVQPWHLAVLSTVLIIYTFIVEMKALLYFATKVFFHSIISIFFREVGWNSVY